MPQVEQRLVVPEGLLLTETTRDRLERQLRAAPDDIGAVAAEVAELPSGSSYVTEAQWRALEPRASVFERADRTVRGAALLRPGVRYDVTGDAMSVIDAAVLVDPGAHVHDPRRAIDALVPASERGRPPFPRRPVVVFLGLEHDPAHADWARRVANRLIRRDVEARLALPVAPPGLHLTRPCMGVEASIAALRPDVVVMLDDGAKAVAAEWCGTDRSTVLIELDRRVEGIELVSWTIGKASGRLRARIGPFVQASSLVRLVHRLCAGPHPMPPSDQDLTPRVTPTMPSARREPVRHISLITSAETAESERVQGFVDYCRAANVVVRTLPSEHALTAAAENADLALVIGDTAAPALAELVARRRRAGKVTVVDLGPGDLAAHGVALSAGARALVEACAHATGPPGAVATALAELPARTLVLPTLLSRERALAAFRSTQPRPEPDDRAIGWHLGFAGDPVPTYLEAVGEAIAKVLADDPGTSLHATGQLQRLPPVLQRHDRVRATSAIPELDTLAGWMLHVWTPHVHHGHVAADAAPLYAVSVAGVVTVMPAAARELSDPHLGSEMLVEQLEEPQDWFATVRTLLDDRAKRTHLEHLTIRRAHAVHGPTASKLVVNRFLGWAAYAGHERAAGRIPEL